jgi:hypothetical protein
VCTYYYWIELLKKEKKKIIVAAAWKTDHDLVREAAGTRQRAVTEVQVRHASGSAQGGRMKFLRFEIQFASRARRTCRWMECLE